MYEYKYKYGAYYPIPENYTTLDIRGGGLKEVAVVELFSPLEHGSSVFELWEVSLGKSYPVSERIFRQNVFANPFYDAGDGFVALEKGRVVAFALVKLDRRTPLPDRGALGVVLVHPDHRRKGLGRALVAGAAERLRDCGVGFMGAASPAAFRFWPGVPMDLEVAVPFFQSVGFNRNRREGIYDLVRTLDDFEIPERILRSIEREGVEIEPAGYDDIPEILSFEQRNFPGWVNSLMLSIAYGNVEDIFVVKRGGKIVGTLNTYSSGSRFRAANVVWDRLLGKELGGMCCVGIEEAQRKKGLGLALCAVATDKLKERGAHCSLIDWTGYTEFYGKLGYGIWREYWMGEMIL